MTISGALSSARSGLAADVRRLGVVADNIANVNTAGFLPAEAISTTVVTRQGGGFGYAGGGVETSIRPTAILSAASLEISNVDLADEFSRMIQARAAYGLGAGLLRASDEMQREIVDVTV